MCLSAQISWQGFSDTLFTLLKLVFEELLERAKEKEEKEAKKRQRLADDFTKLLYTFKVWWHIISRETGIPIYLANSM